MTYLFLGIPNFCGSTLTHNLIATSPDVVTLPQLKMKEDGSEKWKIDFVEGNIIAPGGYRNLLGPHSMEANMEHVYNNPKNYDWKFIKKIWNKQWNERNRIASIRLQKTPSDIFRIPMMKPYFPNWKWIISVRDPYAYVESIARKATFKMEPLRQLDQICYHVARVMELQIQNIEFLGDDCYKMTYEDFCSRPEYHREQLGIWLPGLEKIDFTKEFNVKGTHTNVINDDTEQRIQNMIDGVPEIMGMINEFFDKPKLKPIFDYWGYKIRS